MPITYAHTTTGRRVVLNTPEEEFEARNGAPRARDRRAALIRGMDAGTRWERVGEEAQPQRRLTGHTPAPLPPSREDVRAWARENGVQVSERGAIAKSVITAYKTAHEDQA